MRTTGSTMSRFDKHRAVKSSGMPHSRRDNAVRGNPAAHQNKNVPKGVFLFCIVVYGLGHTIVRLFGSEQAHQRAVKGARRNFIAVGITIHPLPPK